MAEIMFFAAGIFPIGIPLQEPRVSWAPLVSVCPAQKLIKLALSLSGVSKLIATWKRKLTSLKVLGHPLYHLFQAPGQFFRWPFEVH